MVSSLSRWYTPAASPSASRDSRPDEALARAEIAPHRLIGGSQIDRKR